MSIYLNHRPFERVSRRRRCPVCGRADWCLISADGATSICQRVTSDCRAGEAGYVHALTSHAVQAPGSGQGIVLRPRALPDPKFAARAAYYTACANGHLEPLAHELDVSVLSLLRLGVGKTFDGGVDFPDAGDRARALSSGWSAWTFPMRDAHRRVVGVRTRSTVDGSKGSIRGGREGLFIPTGLGAADTLFVAEGPTDTAALLDLGYDAIGRPSCTGGTRLVEEFLHLNPYRHIVIVADDDDPGLRGALVIGRRLACVAADVRVIVPPKPYKDVRQWISAGADRNAVAERLRAASPITPQFL